MTKKEAAIISAYTDILIGSVADMHEYAKEKLNRPIFIHEFANKTVVEELKAAAKENFCNIQIEG